MKNAIKKNYIWLIISAITILSLGLRIKGCFWGYPLQLHVDEPVIVDYTVNMLWNHSWEAQVFDRPDHFEIKCDSIIFSIFSWIKYHKPAYEAYNEHMPVFYVLARIFTALFGTALIPLSALYMKRLLSNQEKVVSDIGAIIAALFVAFEMRLIENAVYATPDVVLTFLVLLFAYHLDVYLENAKAKSIYFCAVIIGIGMTTKYPAAILCLPLAIAVVYKTIADKNKFSDIPKYGLQSIALIFINIFVIGPNLITNFQTVYTNFIEEARPTHMGADGLGFFGNLKFYVQVLYQDTGLLAMILCIIGIVYSVIKLRARFISLSVGIIYWICMSYLSLHWIRWGLPFFPFYLFFVCMGFVCLFNLVHKLLADKNKIALRVVTGVCIALLFVMTVNIVVSGLSAVKRQNLINVKQDALRYMNENGIDTNNAFFESFTDYKHDGSYREKYAFDVFDCRSDGSVQIKLEYATKRYIVQGSSVKSRYVCAPDTYPDEFAVYYGLDQSDKLVYMIEENDSYSTEPWMIKNIITVLKYLTDGSRYTGGYVKIFDLHPTCITLQNEEGLYLKPQSDEAGALVELSTDPYFWIKYDNEDGSFALVSPNSGAVLNIYADWEAGTIIPVMWNPTNDEYQRFSFTENTLALSSGNFSLYSTDGIAIGGTMPDSWTMTYLEY